MPRSSRGRSGDQGSGARNQGESWGQERGRGDRKLPDLICFPDRLAYAATPQSKGMSLSSSIPLTRLRSATPIHDEIQEVDEIFHNLNAFDSPEIIPGPRWKTDLHALLEQPTSSPSAFVMHVSITALIIISALVTVFETVPTFRKISNAVWFGFETTLVALFTMEYIARSLAWSGSWWLYFRWATCTSCSPARFSSFVASLLVISDQTN